MEGDDELLRGLGVTARGERDVARDVIRDAAVAAAAREAAARDARRGGDGGGRGDVADDAGGDGDAGPSDAGTSGGGGGGDGPVAKELARLREESERLARELGAVRDALDEVRERQKNGDAPVDAALQIAVGERRVQGLTDKRDALAAKIDDAEANAAAEASERASAAPAPPPPGVAPSRGDSHRKKSGTSRAPRRPAPAPVSIVQEDDDFDKMLNAVEGRGAGAGGGEIGETERERLIRTGVITPFDNLSGFDRSVRVAETTGAHIASMTAYKVGRSATQLLEGDAVPKQRPEARSLANGRANTRRRGWTLRLPPRSASGERLRRRRKRERTEGGARSGRTPSPVDAGVKRTPRTAATRTNPTRRKRSGTGKSRRRR